VLVIAELIGTAYYRLLEHRIRLRDHAWFSSPIYENVGA